MHLLRKSKLELYNQFFILMCLSIGTPKTINFPFGTNEKLIVLDVPILIKGCVYVCVGGGGGGG